MSVSERSPESSKKLGSLLLSLSIVAFLFALVVGLGLLLPESRPSSAPIASDHPGIAVSPTPVPGESQLADTGTVEGSTRVSLLRSVSLVLSSADGARWLDANAGWRLFMAKADYMDSRGLARHWSLVIRSPDSALIAYVDDGVACVLSIEDNEASDLPPPERQMLMDSNYLLSNVTAEKGIHLEINSTLFSLAFNDDGADGGYTLTYTDLVDSSCSFTGMYNAKNGEIFEDTN